jgi:fatty-acyl-CoA synthase
VRLVDEGGHADPAGAVGEIIVRSEFPMQGYWRNPQETARTKRHGWVHTGDLGVFDAEGFLSIVGRSKEVIRSGGETIFPAEIERLLLAHDEIREAAVVGIPDPHWGEAVVAAIVRHDGSTLTAEDVIGYLRGHLAGYKKPRHVCFLTELPRTAASQQVHKPLLREMVIELIAAVGHGMPCPYARASARNAAPMTPAESPWTLRRMGVHSSSLMT